MDCGVYTVRVHRVNFTYSFSPQNFPPSPSCHQLMILFIVFFVQYTDNFGNFLSRQSFAQASYYPFCVAGSWRKKCPTRWFNPYRPGTRLAINSRILRDSLASICRTYTLDWGPINSSYIHPYTKKRGPGVQTTLLMVSIQYFSVLGHNLWHREDLKRHKQEISHFLCLNHACRYLRERFLTIYVSPRYSKLFRVDSAYAEITFWREVKAKSFLGLLEKDPVAIPYRIYKNMSL